MQCPRCKHKIPIKECLLLSNNAVITCKHCSARLRPEKMSTAYFGAGFLLTGPPSLYIALHYDSLPKGLLFGTVWGSILYVGVVVYVYFTVRLFEI